jgi:hypothetical protein
MIFFGASFVGFAAGFDLVAAFTGAAFFATNFGSGFFGATFAAGFVGLMTLRVAAMVNDEALFLVFFLSDLTLRLGADFLTEDFLLATVELAFWELFVFFFKAFFAILFAYPAEVMKFGDQKHRSI